MWQKCPICNGLGTVPNYGISSSANSVCTVCNGAKIISELTGLPPNYSDIPSKFKPSGTLEGLSTGTSTTMWHNFVPSENLDICVVCGSSKCCHPSISTT